jgi:hypothetical protein
VREQLDAVVIVVGVEPGVVALAERVTLEAIIACAQMKDDRCASSSSSSSSSIVRCREQSKQIIGAARPNGQAGVSEARVAGARTGMASGGADHETANNQAAQPIISRVTGARCATSRAHERAHARMHARTHPLLGEIMTNSCDATSGWKV